MCKDNEDIVECGQVVTDNERGIGRLGIMTIIGEIEGHDNAASGVKTTKYEHMIPKMIEAEENDEISGVLFVINTIGGDVECGLAMAEMIASLSKPTVSIVIGGSHSIGAPLAVAADYSFVVPTGTMVIHPVRMNGLQIGVSQTFNYYKKIQDRITAFVTSHSGITAERYEQLMTETEVLTRDIGSILVGKEMVDEKIIDEVGGLSQAIKKLKCMVMNRLNLEIKSQK